MGWGGFLGVNERVLHAVFRIPHGGDCRNTRIPQKWPIKRGLGKQYCPEWIVTAVDGWNPANQLRLVAYPIIFMVSYIPGGAGFQPSTVLKQVFPETAVELKSLVWICFHVPLCIQAALNALRVLGSIRFHHRPPLIHPQDFLGLCSLMTYLGMRRRMWRCKC